MKTLIFLVAQKLTKTLAFIKILALFIQHNVPSKNMHSAVNEIRKRKLRSDTEKDTQLLLIYTALAARYSDVFFTLLAQKYPQISQLPSKKEKISAALEYINNKLKDDKRMTDALLAHLSRDRNITSEKQLLARHLYRTMVDRHEQTSLDIALNNPFRPHPIEHSRSEESKSEIAQQLVDAFPEYRNDFLKIIYQYLYTELGTGYDQNPENLSARELTPPVKKPNKIVYH